MLLWDRCGTENGKVFRMRTGLWQAPLGANQGSVLESGITQREWMGLWPMRRRESAAFQQVPERFNKDIWLIISWSFQIF